MADQEHRDDDDDAAAAACGICGADVPPLIGRVLTGTGLTLDQAANLLEDDHDLPPALTAVQRRLVQAHALHRA